MHRLLLFLALEELTNGPAENGANERREEGEDDGGIETGDSLIVIVGVGVFDAAWARLYIF